MKLLNTCPICNNQSLAPYAMKFQPGFPHISRTICKSCGIVFANPMADFDELIDFYTNYYDKGNFGALLYKKKVTDSIKLLSTKPVEELKKENKNIILYKDSGNFLDVGFGLGEQLYIAHRLGFTVYGTEFDLACLNFIKNILPGATLFNGDLSAAAYADAFFDVVNVCHVIEHLIDPINYVKELKRITKPGGILIISTPDIGAWPYRLFRILNFLSLKVPLIVDGLEHTVTFNKRNLSRFLSTNGLTVIDHYSESITDSWSNISKSNLSILKKVLRYCQTKLKINQVIICRN